MKPEQQSFDTFARWLLTRMRADLACEAACTPLQCFFIWLYEDMLSDPGIYGVPLDPYVVFYARQTLTAEEDAQHEALKATRMRVRKGVMGYIEFLYGLGQAGTPAGGYLLVPKPEFAMLEDEYARKTRNRNFLQSLERTGLSFYEQGSQLRVSNDQFPAMPAELATFSKACARVKEFGFYLFRRCDLAVLKGKNSPAFADALHLVPISFRQEVAETDERLGQMRFKRQIFVDGGDMTYRVRYNKKSDTAVYWLRILETFQPDLKHYLRWKVDSALTVRLFAHLDRVHPGLADRVFTGLTQCSHCYGGSCMARGLVERGGVVKEVCKEYGWNDIGYERENYEDLWKVLAAFTEDGVIH